MAYGIPKTHVAPRGSWVKIGGKKIPFPAYGTSQGLYTTLKSARNAKNVLTGQKVGRDQYKIDNVVFPVLSASDWAWLLSLGDDYYVTVRFFAMDKNCFATTRMYVGDRTAEVLRLDENTGAVLLWKNCQMNLIDVGSTITYEQ